MIINSAMMTKKLQCGKANRAVENKKKQCLWTDLK